MGAGPYSIFMLTEAQVQELLEGLTKRANACDKLCEVYHAKGRGHDAARTGGKSFAYEHAVNLIQLVLAENASQAASREDRG